MKIHFNRFHRWLLVGTGSMIFIYQTVAIGEDPEHFLNGIDWIVAYVVAVAMIILGSQAHGPQKP